MIYRNIELHNVESIIHNDDGSISWRRVPDSVYENLEAENGKAMAEGATGVEMRFVIKKGDAIIKMSTEDGNGVFHVYRGGIQGGWKDHEEHKLVGTTAENYVISADDNIDRLKIITKKCGYDWDPEVVRIIFDRGKFKIYDIIGDIEPPDKSQCPKRRILSYGSSITHGSNSIDMSHAWVSVLSHNLNMDVRNLGMAGSCYIEPEFAQYIASEGENGNWDIATLELGINVLDWDEAKIRDRVRNIIVQVAGENKDKLVFVISPFYHCGDDFDDSRAAYKWRKIIEDEIVLLNYRNVIYINGLDIIGDMSYMSADLTHPNIYGVSQIAEKMTDIIKFYIDSE